MDLQLLIFVFPAGVVLLFRELRDEHVFVIIYAFVGSYFAGVMVRLMLTLTPVVCVSAAIALSSLFDVYLDQTPASVVEETSTESNGATVSAASSDAGTVPPSKKSKKAVVPPVAAETAPAVTTSDSTTRKRTKGIHAFDSRFAVILNAFGLLSLFVLHCTWVTSSAYSSPSVVLASSNPDGSQHIIDDFREAYYWLRQNTEQDAVVMSWWDYGYQIAGMADRPTLVDNNTWNNSEFCPAAVSSRI